MIFTPTRGKFYCYEEKRVNWTNVNGGDERCRANAD